MAAVPPGAPVPPAPVPPVAVAPQNALPTQNLIRGVAVKAVPPLPRPVWDQVPIQPMQCLVTGVDYRNRDMIPVNYLTHGMILVTPCGLSSTSWEKIGGHFRYNNCYWCSQFSDRHFERPRANFRTKNLHALKTLLAHVAAANAILNDPVRRQAVQNEMDLYLQRNPDRKFMLEPETQRIYPKLHRDIRDYLPLRVSHRDLGDGRNQAMYVYPGMITACFQCGDVFALLKSHGDHMRREHQINCDISSRYQHHGELTLTARRMTDDNVVDQCNHFHKRYMLNSIGLTCVPIDHVYDTTGTADQQLAHALMSQPAQVPFDPVTGIMEVRFKGTNVTGHLFTDQGGWMRIPPGQELMGNPANSVPRNCELRQSNRTLLGQVNELQRNNQRVRTENTRLGLDANASNRERACVTTERDQARSECERLDARLKRVDAERARLATALARANVDLNTATVSRNFKLHPSLSPTC